MIKDFWKRAVVMDWKKNILPVLVAMYACFIIMAAIGYWFIPAIALTMTFAGTISCVISSPNKYLAAISQLLIPPIIVLGLMFVLVLSHWFSSSVFGPDIGIVDIVLIFIFSNLLSILMDMCIRYVYLNVLNKMSRTKKIIYIILLLTGYGAIVFVFATLATLLTPTV